MHDWLVGFALKVVFPAFLELRTHDFEFVLSRSDFDAGFDAVSRQRTAAGLIPLVKHTFLDLGIATEKFVRSFLIILGAVERKREIMILEILADTGEINKRLNTRFPENVRVANAT